MLFTCRIIQFTASQINSSEQYSSISVFGGVGGGGKESWGKIKEWEEKGFW